MKNKVTDLSREYSADAIRQWLDDDRRKTAWSSAEGKEWDEKRWKVWKDLSANVTPRNKRLIEIVWSVFIFGFCLLVGHLFFKTVGKIVFAAVGLLAAGAFIIILEAFDMIRREDDNLLIEKNDALFKNDKDAYKKLSSDAKDMW